MHVQFLAYPVDAGFAITLISEHPAVGRWWRQIIKRVAVPFAVTVWPLALAALLLGLVVASSPGRKQSQTRMHAC